MSKFKTLLIVSLISFTSITHAKVCKSTHDGLSFRQVVLEKDVALRCDYGPTFDFSHSYVVYGSFEPVSGPWSDGAEPMLIFCQGNNLECVYNNMKITAKIK